MSQNDKDHFEVIKISENLPNVDICSMYIEDFLTASGRKFVEMMQNKIK